MGLQATTLQRLIARASLVTPLFVQLLASAFSAGSEDDFFEAKIRPILVQRCEACHSAEKGKTKGGLALDLPVHFAHRNHIGLENSGQNNPFVCKAEICLFRRYFNDRNQIVEKRREMTRFQTETELVNTNRDECERQLRWI